MQTESASLWPTLKSVFSLLASYGLLMLATGLFSTLLAVRTRIEGFSTEVVGLVMAAYFLGLMLGALHAVRVVSAVGHIRAFAAFASMVSITALAHPLLIDPWFWALMRLIAGFCMAGLFMVTESWLNERANNATRGQILSFYMITNYFFAGCGQFLLPLADPALFQLFSVASILFSLALVPVLLTRASAPRAVKPQRLNLRDLYRVSPLGIVGALCAGLLNAPFYSMGPVFTQGIGLTLSETSLFMAIVIFSGLLLQWPVGRASDLIDRRWMIAIVGLLTCAACLALEYFGTGQSISLYVAGAAYGGLAFTLYSLSISHTNDFANPEQLMQTSGGLLVAYGIGAVSGPILAAAIMGQMGVRSLFFYSAAVSGSLGLYSIIRMRSRAPASAEHKANYVPQPGAEFTSEELYTAEISGNDGKEPEIKSERPL